MYFIIPVEGLSTDDQTAYVGELYAESEVLRVVCGSNEVISII